SIQLYPGGLDHRLPLPGLVREDLCKIQWGAEPRFHSQLFKAGANIVGFQSLVYSMIENVDDWCWRARGCKQSEGHFGWKSNNAHLPHRGSRWQLMPSPFSRDGECLQLSLFDVCKQHRLVVEDHVDVTPEQIGDGGSGAFVGDKKDIGSCFNL